MFIRIGIAQMGSGENKAKNLKVAKEMVISAAEKGAELVLLPELFGYLPPTIDKKRYFHNAKDANGQTLTMLIKIAKERVGYHSRKYNRKEQRGTIQHLLSDCA
jgi:omega-amidase